MLGVVSWINNCCDLINLIEGPDWRDRILHVFAQRKGIKGCMYSGSALVHQALVQFLDA